MKWLIIIMLIPACGPKILVPDTQEPVIESEEDEIDDDIEPWDLDYPTIVNGRITWTNKNLRLRSQAIRPILQKPKKT